MPEEQGNDLESTAEELVSQPTAMGDIPELQARAVGMHAVDPRPMSNIDPVIRIAPFYRAIS